MMFEIFDDYEQWLYEQISFCKKCLDAEHEKKQQSPSFIQNSISISQIESLVSKILLLQECLDNYKIMKKKIENN